MRPKLPALRRLVASTTILAGLACAAAAQAADLPMYRKAAPVAAVAPTWSGFYVGGAVGSGVVVHDVGVALGGANVGLNGIGGRGFLASGFFGFDYQFAPRWVIGIMGDGTWSNIGPELDVTGGGLNVNASVRADWSWSALARLGFLTSPTTMWYAMGGYTWQNFHTRLDATAPPAAPVNFRRDDGVSGWTVGVGVESEFWWPGWYTRTEYRYTHFENTPFFGGALGIQPSMHTARTALLYKFGGNAVGGARATFEQERPSWTGLYLGVAGGGGAVVHDINVAVGGANVAFDGVGGEGALASVYGGFDYHLLPRFVVGVMADGTWSDIKTTLNATIPGNTLAASVKADAAWSVLGRVGYLSSPSTMFYVGGGYTWQNFHSRLAVNAAPALTRDDSVNGFTYVSGLESVFAGNWAAKLEYRYTWFERENFFAGALGIKPAMHTVRAGLSYKFNLSSGPVMASY